MSQMSLIDRECVRRLLDSQHPDATLIFLQGDCVVLPATEVDDAHRALIITSRAEVLAQLPDGPVTDRALDDLAVRLDNVVRDLSA
ncbi:hypothetical protein [Nonomuraea sp. NPDC002799]